MLTLIDGNLAGFASASSGPGGPLSLSANNPAQGIALVDLGAQTVTHNDGVTTYSGFSNYFGLNDLFVTPGRVQSQRAQISLLAGLLRETTWTISADAPMEPAA